MLSLHFLFPRTYFSLSSRSDFSKVCDQNVDTAHTECCRGLMKTESRLLFPWHPSVGSMSTHHAPKEQLSKPAVVKTASNSGILTSTSSTPNRSTTDPGPGGQGHYARTQPRAEGTSSRTPSKHDARPSSSSASKLRLSSSSSSNHGQSSHHQQSTSSSHHSSSNQRSNHSSSHQHHERGNHSHQHSVSS